MKYSALQPIDKLALPLIFSLCVLIAALAWGGQNCGPECFFNSGPRVKSFSWQGKTIGADDKAFIFTFDRPMDRASVEDNLVIEPALPGKFSWSGRKLAYTLESPALYGETYQVYLRGAREQFFNSDRPAALIQPYAGQFQTRDRAFAYIGTQGEEQGRLILFNITQQRKLLLTAPELVVTDFEFYPLGDRLLFSAAERGSDTEGLLNLELYTVSIPEMSALEEDSDPIPAAQKILDNQQYQNLKFDLSRDGKSIVVQRVSRENISDFGLWVIHEGEDSQPLNQPGGEFVIAPDSQTLAVAQGQGIAILPLFPDAQPAEFLPRFGKVLGFSRDGTAAAMVNFNTDQGADLQYTQSLYYVNNLGVEKELLRVEGSILECQFNPNATQLYCLLSELLDTEVYEEKPYFAQIDLITGKVTPLISLPKYQDITMSVAPDGLGILFDQITTSPATETPGELRSDAGEAIVGGQLWLLIPPRDLGHGLETDENNSSVEPTLEELSVVGLRPQWLP